jgi:hypothetical protein
MMPLWPEWRLRVGIGWLFLKEIWAQQPTCREALESCLVKEGCY